MFHLALDERCHVPRTRVTHHAREQGHEGLNDPGYWDKGMSPLRPYTSGDYSALIVVTELSLGP